MVAVVKPKAEDIETAVLGPGCRIAIPAIQFLHENLLAQILQDSGDIIVGFAFRNQIDGWLVRKLRQGKIGAGRTAPLCRVRQEKISFKIGLEFCP